jgi:hypothetical protein
MSVKQASSEFAKLEAFERLISKEFSLPNALNASTSSHFGKFLM